MLTGRCGVLPRAFDGSRVRGAIGYFSWSIEGISASSGKIATRWRSILARINVFPLSQPKPSRPLRITSIKRFFCRSKSWIFASTSWSSDRREVAKRAYSRSTSWTSDSSNPGKFSISWWTAAAITRVAKSPSNVVPGEQR